jgi:hypothetical protein
MWLTRNSRDCGLHNQRFDPVTSLRVLIEERVTHAFPVYAVYWLPIIYQPDFRPSELSELA